MNETDLESVIAAYLLSDDPIPEEEQNCAGDGEFRLIGAEFLRHFVRLGDLRPDENILEVGCGVGRMALPLTRFLSDRGRYRGMDVKPEGIDWCRSVIATKDPRFGFDHQDIRNELYNPMGRLSAADVTFPAADATVDFLVFTSVFTHLSEEMHNRYIAEAARVLAPGGRMFATFFLINQKSRSFLPLGQSRVPFDLSKPGPIYHLPDDNPMTAVATNEAWLEAQVRSVGLEIDRPFVSGHWSSGNPEDGVSYQDILVMRPGHESVVATG